MCTLPFTYDSPTITSRSTVNHVHPLNHPFRTPTHQGPTLTPGELCQEMLRRKQEVQREKAREKEKARVEKLKQVGFFSSLCVFLLDRVRYACKWIS